MSDSLQQKPAAGHEAGTTTLQLVLHWLWVAVPLAWGVTETIRASLAFFR